MHQIHAENLKSQLKGDSIERFQNSSAIRIRTGQEIIPFFQFFDFFMFQDLPRAR